jgi:hypothetical protein
VTALLRRTAIGRFRAFGLGYARVMDLNSFDWLALYGAILSTLAIGWQFWTAWSKKREREKDRRRVQVHFGIPKDFKIPGNDAPMRVYPLCVSHTGHEPIVLSSVEVRYENGVSYPGAYPEPEAVLGIHNTRLLPKRLESGDTIELPLFTIATFQMTPLEVIVIDGEGREHKVQRTV